MLWLTMRHARKVLGTGRGKALTYGIFAPTARDGLDPIILSCGLNRLVAKFVASASEKGLGEAAKPILSRRSTNKANSNEFVVM
jgi:hypothetical protein